MEPIMELSDLEGPREAGVFVSYELGWGATITRVVKPFSFPLTSLSSGSRQRSAAYLV